MTRKYYIRDQGTGAYCESEHTDVLYDKNVIDVPKMPAHHVWDNKAKAWVFNKESYLNILRRNRNAELARTDKYMLPDYHIMYEDRLRATQYRQALRNAPNHEKIEDCVLPKCPDCLLN